MVKKCKKNGIELYILKLQNNLKAINFQELKNKIEEFFLMDLKKESKEKIKQIIKSIINPEKGILVNFQFIVRMEKEKKLYRARNLYGDENFKIEEKYELWNPPEEFVKKYERLNLPNESVLYTSLDFKTCLDETEIKINDYFLLIEYKTLYEINLINIPTIKELEKEIETFPLENNSREKLKLIFNFIIRCFQMNNYTVSNIIKDMFYYDKNCDGWIYSSVKNSSSKNIVLLPEVAKENKLRIEKITMFKKIDEETLETIYNIGLNSEGEFVHLKPFI